MFMKYKVAGAYDSNIALLLTKGEDRLDSYERLSEVLAQHHPARQRPGHQPRIPLRPGQLVPRQQRHAKPTTRFVVPYLALVGTLKEEANKLDPVYAFLQMKKHYAKQIAEQFPDDPEASPRRMSALLDRKGTADYPPDGAPAGRPAPALRLAEHEHQKLPHRQRARWSG